ncbi:hypothetical protein T492DRAFT_836127 [Pavlovales sp. CCMP2436]|nr:hypothetical protein T492DRAFT_836127 [Pavlovales sp. CCMP2436]
MATRSMQQAEYFRAGALSLEEALRSLVIHIGLAAEIYTHFTSPIRRYSDQLVHRMLAAAIGIEPLSQVQLHIQHIIVGIQKCEGTACLQRPLGVNLFHGCLL